MSNMIGILWRTASRK